MSERRGSETDAPALFEVGVIIGTRGLRGELRVRPVSGSGTALLEASTVWLALPGKEPAPFAVRKASLLKEQVMLQLEALDRIEQVEALRGVKLSMRYADLDELADDSYYWHQLQGLRVVDARHGEIGTLEEMFSTAAHDIYVVHGPRGEVLIPAVAAFIVEVDLQARCMRVDLPDGLIPGTDAV